MNNNIQTEVVKKKITLLEAIREIEKNPHKYPNVRRYKSEEELSKELEYEFTDEEVTFTGQDLVKIPINEIPFLWDRYFPKVGLVGVCGNSDSGKSTFVRDLCIAIGFDCGSYLGRKLRLKYKSAIYISSEDDQLSFSMFLKKQAKKYAGDGLKRLRVGLNVINPINYLEKELSKEGADFIVLDVWGDYFTDSPNDFTKVRANLKKYSELAIKYKTCICIIHHYNKKSNKSEPDKANLNGSQAIEAKLRTLLELRELKNGNKQLSILKGNYIPYSEKKKRLILRQDENLSYSKIAEITSKDEDSEKREFPKSGNLEIKKRAKSLYNSKQYSQDQVLELLKEEFGDEAPSKGTLNKMLRED